MHQYKKNHSNYRGNSVSKEVFIEYASEYGRIHQCSRNGEYEGFIDGTFDNTAHQNHDRS